MEQLNEEFYKVLAKEQFFKTTRRTSFRQLLNQDKSASGATDVVAKLNKQKQGSPVATSSAFKYAMQEYAPSPDAERRQILRLK